MSKLAIVIMLIAAAGMIFGLSKQKAGAAWGKPLAVVCAIVALLCALGNIFTSGGPDVAQVRDREMAYQKIGAQKLGLFLAEKYSGAKAIIIVEPTLSAGAVKPSAVLDGLKAGFGTSITIVEEISPDIPESARNAFSEEMPMDEGGEGGEMLPPLEFWFTAKIFDEMVKKNTDKCDLIVTTIGLPMDLGAMKFWTMKKRPNLALASGSVYELKKAIAGEAIVAAVTYNPKAVYDEKNPPADLDAAFDKRYLLVTPENIASVAGQYGDLFKK